jgi:hypothetical protein
MEDIKQQQQIKLLEIKPIVQEIKKIHWMVSNSWLGTVEEEISELEG